MRETPIRPRTLFSAPSAADNARMPSWLTTAREAVTGGTVSAKPQEYVIVCRCGREIAGTRGDDERTETCEACGTEWFVLPRDVYPRPVRAPQRKTPRPRPGVPSAPKPPAEPRVPPGTRAVRGAAAVGNAAKTRTATAAGGLRRWVRGQATPLRLVLAALVLTVLLTAGWLVQQERLAAARRTFDAAGAAADALLAAKGYAGAADLYGRAADAADRSGATGRRAAVVRRRARELGAAGNLAIEPPFRIAGEAAAAGDTPSARAAWRERFAALYADRWVVLDTTAVRRTARRPATAGDDDAGNTSAGEPAVALLFPLSAGTADVRFDGDLPPLADLPAGGEPRRVVLAARYRDCRAAVDPVTERTVWTIRLNPADAFLWADPDTLAAVGLVDGTGPDAALAAVLARQAVDGIEPNAAAPP